ncbi:hypothetical protein [Streptomyces ossamyceticus]|uniref:hypothetical protein n=1 Tax=Streptomyces ossamyceticus TaxID=249581 RepID=UPI0006E25136|nr:hypothetical protein [Streptomyces ossamyceticus]
MNRPLRGAATLVAVLVTASCTADAAPQAGPSASKTSAASRTLPKNWTCQKQRFHWGKVTKREKLAAVSDAQEIHIPAGRTVASTFDLVPLRTLKAAISPALPDGTVNPQAAVDSLAEQTGLDLAKVGTTFTLSKGDKTLKTSSGKFDGVLVAVVGVDTVEASFVYGCGAEEQEAVRGTLTTWSAATYSALFACGIREDLSAVEIEAEALLCGEQSD